MELCLFKKISETICLLGRREQREWFDDDSSLIIKKSEVEMRNNMHEGEKTTQNWLLEEYWDKSVLRRPGGETGGGGKTTKK